LHWARKQQVWDEAENRMWTSMAVFLKLLGYEKTAAQLK
jgi:hypothetical protein